MGGTPTIAVLRTAANCGLRPALSTGFAAGSPRGSPYSYYARLVSGIVTWYAVDVGTFGVAAGFTADPELSLIHI